MKPLQWLYEISAYLLALLFLFTALSKILDLHHFVGEMNNQVFPKPVAALLIVLVPLAELVATALLIIPKSRKKGFWLSFLMMASFTIYVGLVTLHIFPRVPCSCAGVFKHLSWSQHLIFNMAFTIIAIIGLSLSKKQFDPGVKRQGL